MNVCRFVQHLVERRSTLQLKANFLTTVFAMRTADTVFEFHLSDKVEPYAIIIAFDPESDELLVQLSRQQLAGLREAIKAFMRRHRLPEARFHYTGLEERQATDRFVSDQGIRREAKAHSTVFHLKMQVPHDFYVARFPMLGAMDLGRMMALDPVQYNYSRTTMSLEEAFQAMERDAR